ncbi:ABC transporter substrate-binding protein [Streptomyces sp. NPDC004134]|uniref:nSTAND3 domain-containing NTPase n=1 Tax=Streptomyces sp. NPDC004134 TaxID=3364691 RepID=UPI0036C841A1
MTDFGTFVGEARAPFHTGAGDQYIFFAEMAEASQRLGTHGKDRRAIAERQLGFLYERFVPPRRLGEARHLLHGNRTVVLSGEPGVGRRSAAQMLLYERAAAGSGIHEVDPEDDEDGRVTLDRRTVADGDRLLLDLSACETNRFLGVQSELSAFRAVVEQRGARLVVVVSPRLEGSLNAELQRLTVPLGRPRSADVLMRHLRREGITPPPAALAAPALAHFLTAVPMRDVARLADLIRRSRNDSPAGSFSTWWPDRLAQLVEDDPQGPEFVRGLANGRQRALALTVAMLHGCAPDTIYHAATALLAVVDHPEDERPRLDRADFNTELSNLECVVGQGRVRFTEPGHVRAVLGHFWSYFPDLRPHFRTWVAYCGQKLRLNRQERDQLIDHFAEQSLRTGRPEELVALAREWTPQGTRGFMPDAVQALAAALRDDVHGRAVRQEILAQLKKETLSRTYRLALTVVCSDVIAVSHPDEALVRLHYLARADDDGDRRPALDALLTLVTSEPRLCGRLLYRLTAYGIGPRGFRAPEDRIFLALADAAARDPDLCTGTTARRRLAECWAAVFAHRPHAEWAPHVPAWLTAAQAARTPAHRDALLATLAAAAAPYPAAAGRTYVLSQGWALAAGSDRAQRRDVAERYRRRLDAAQGIGRRAAEPEPPDTDAPPEAPR